MDYGKVVKIVVILHLVHYNTSVMIQDDKYEMRIRISK